MLFTMLKKAPIKSAVLASSKVAGAFVGNQMGPAFVSYATRSVCLALWEKPKTWLGTFMMKAAAEKIGFETAILATPYCGPAGALVGLGLGYAAVNTTEVVYNNAKNAHGLALQRALNKKIAQIGNAEFVNEGKVIIFSEILTNDHKDTGFVNITQRYK